MWTCIYWMVICSNYIKLTIEWLPGSLTTFLPVKDIFVYEKWTEHIQGLKCRPLTNWRESFFHIFKSSTIPYQRISKLLLQTINGRIIRLVVRTLPCIIVGGGVCYYLLYFWIEPPPLPTNKNKNKDNKWNKNTLIRFYQLGTEIFNRISTVSDIGIIIWRISYNFRFLPNVKKFGFTVYGEVFGYGHF